MRWKSSLKISTFKAVKAAYQVSGIGFLHKQTLLYHLISVNKNFDHSIC